MTKAAEALLEVKAVAMLPTHTEVAPEIVCVAAVAKGGADRCARKQLPRRELR